MTERSDREAQQLAAIHEIMREQQATRAHMTELTTLFSSQAVNGVLEVGTGVLDSTGVFSRDFRAPFAAVSIVNPAPPLFVAGAMAGGGGDLVLALPGAGALTGVDVGWAAPGAALATTAVISGLVGGGFTEFTRVTTAGLSTGWRWDDLPAAAGATPTVTFPNVVSGPNVTATVFGRGGPLIATNSPRGQAAPGSGVGLFDVPARAAMTRAMAGNTLSVYGAPGQRFSWTVFAKPVPETFGRVG
jgi:hypothetical protein